MVGTVTRARCANCGAVLTPGFDPNGTCPKCQFELHCCKQCRFFDSGAQFECTQPIQERISPKDAKNACTFYEFRMTIEKDTAPTSYTQPAAPGSAPPPGPPRHTDARQAFETSSKVVTHLNPFCPPHGLTQEFLQRLPIVAHPSRRQVFRIAFGKSSWSAAWSRMAGLAAPRRRA